MKRLLSLLAAGCLLAVACPPVAACLRAVSGAPSEVCDSKGRTDAEHSSAAGSPTPVRRPFTAGTQRAVPAPMFARLTAALCPGNAVALAEGLPEAQSLTGAQYYPAGADEQTATYVFRYTLPQFAAETELAQTINASFVAMASDMTGAAPTDVAPDSLLAGSPAYYTDLDYTVTADTDDYLSVLLTSRQYLGNSETESWSASTFALNGVYEGQAVSLSQAMGLETADNAATPETTYAAELVYGLVWRIIAEQQAMQLKDYFPELTQTDMRAAFSPESDFYLDTAGNFVFFVQSGAIASEVEGVLTYPFSLAELLSAVGE